MCKFTEILTISTVSHLLFKVTSLHTVLEIYRTIFAAFFYHIYLQTDLEVFFIFVLLFIIKDLPGLFYSNVFCTHKNLLLTSNHEVHILFL